MVFEDAYRRGLIDAFPEGSHDLLDTPRGCFQPAHSSIMTLTEAFPTGLATPPLNGFPNAFDTIAYQGMNVLVCDAAINTGLVGAGMSFAHQHFRTTSFAFDL
jgi:hypothetical protein